MNRRLPHDSTPPTRREFLSTMLTPAAAATLNRLAPRHQKTTSARLIGTVPLSRPGAVPLGRLFGSGLDARRSTDLSRLAPGSMITPNEEFYVRTAMPAEAKAITSWTIALGGLVDAPATLDVASLRQRARPMGACLLECSGNGDPDNFGLMSVARWQGLPLLEVLEQVPRGSNGTHVQITGIDDPISRSRTSLPGASWVFALDDLRDAFLATGMNEQALPGDHGAPVRLVVPGWYGCACIKWVNRIELVNEQALAPQHMLEFAARTHQPSGVARVRDFSPARIEHAAIPIRIEQWINEGRIFYKVVGILWGGSKPVNQLAVRFRPADRFVAVDDCPLPASTRTWSLWSHTWRPAIPGRYEIALRITDPSVPTRRLNALFYRRFVEITDV